MADIKLSALPAPGSTPSSSDSLVGIQGGAASLFTLAQVVGISLPADSTPLDTDQLMVRQLAAPNAPKTLTLARLRAQVDLGVTGGRAVNGGTAATDTLTLANQALPVALFTGVAAATDYLQFTSSAAGGGANGPRLLATGSDATVDMLFDVKGAGARYVFNINGSTKADLNSGAGSGATLRVAGDYTTQIGGGRFGDGTTGMRVNNGGTWVELEVGAAVFFRGTASTIGFLGKASSPAAAQTGGAQTATLVYSATEQAMLQAAYDCLRTFGLLT